MEGKCFEWLCKCWFLMKQLFIISTETPCCIIVCKYNNCDNDVVRVSTCMSHLQVIAKRNEVFDYFYLRVSCWWQCVFTSSPVQSPHHQQFPCKYCRQEVTSLRMSVTRRWPLQFEIGSIAYLLLFLFVDKKNQLDVTFCILYFSSNSCSTCFGQPCAHHQELTTAWCYSIVLVCAVAAGRWSSPVGR